jgi:hypothetical protein
MHSGVTFELDERKQTKNRLKPGLLWVSLSIRTLIPESMNQASERQRIKHETNVTEFKYGLFSDENDRHLL